MKNNKPDYKLILPRISNWEGGIANNKNDYGGYTNRGISIYTWQALAPVLYGIPGNQDTLKTLKKEQWEGVVKYFWDKATYSNSINSQPVSEYFFECLWGQGHCFNPQRVLNKLGYNLIIDGVIGQNTINAVNDAISKNEERLLFELHNRNLEHFQDLCKIDSRQKIFLQGWQNRENDLYIRAQKLLKNESVYEKR